MRTSRSQDRLLVSTTVVFLSTTLFTVVQSLSLQPHLAHAYAQARLMRLQQGHNAAIPLYQECLKRSEYQDITAATRIAVSSDAPARHEAACRPTTNRGSPADEDCPYSDSIRKLRRLLVDSRYSPRPMETLFGIPEDKWAAGAPVYIQPCRAGDMRNAPMSMWGHELEPTMESSLECLVTLFLLGLSVRRDTLVRGLLGGEESVELLQELGLVFPCSMEERLMVPYVHIMPLRMVGEDLSDDTVAATRRHVDDTVYLVTDLHPNVLSSTTMVGSNQNGDHTNGDGAVMYIGPDSLALVQHMEQYWNTLIRTKSMDTTTAIHILDLCTGSGVQALATLHRMPTAHALCIDVNERALRFVKFNAALNGMAERVCTLQGDVTRNTCVLHAEQGEKNDVVDLMEGIGRVFVHRNGNNTENQPVFDVILANPPFIPVPENDEVIQQRYGLFSSGGASGEQALEGIVKLAKKLLIESGGLLAVVSEFMNPPQRDVLVPDADNEELLHRLQQWWETNSTHTRCDVCAANGILFTNERPVSAETYAGRRAASQQEIEVWEHHLEHLGITHISPGLLFVRTAGSASHESLRLQHLLVPKTASGSIWTPSNRDAVDFTRASLKRYWYLP